MRLGEVMAELAQALGRLPGVTVYPYAAARITPPAAIVNFPESIQYDATMARGADRMTFPILLVSSSITAENALLTIEKFVDGSDLATHGVKTILENTHYTAMDSVRVMSVEFGAIEIAGTSFLGATFQVDVIGSGV